MIMQLAVSSASRPLRTQVRWVILAAILTALAALGLAWNRSTTSAVHAGAHTQSGVLPPAIRENMASYTSQFGRNVTSTVEFVEASRSAAQKVIRGSVIEDSQPVYVVQAMGDFVYTAGFVRPGDPAPAGKYLVITFSASTGMMLDLGVMPSSADLGKIGVVRSQSWPSS